jgi:ribosome biogenesis GTPase
MVIKSTGSWYTIMDGRQTVRCRIKGKFRIKGIKTTNPVAVGDKVGYELIADDTGVILHIEERKNYIIRRSASFHNEAHLLAANIDLAFLMVTLKSPATQMEFIDRFLVTAEAYHIKCILLINKIDLLETSDRDRLQNILHTYALAGYSCIELSVPENHNVGKVYDLMKGKLNLIAGNSGVGKTALINAMDPALKLKTNPVSDVHKSGKHTTTFYEIFRLNNDTYIIDTPGIKGFGLIDMEKQEIGLYFPEIFRISKHCKFYNCTHIHEPGCAVKDALEKEEIGKSRYKSYLNIMNDDESKYR